jgi:hypothetical protein
MTMTSEGRFLPRLEARSSSRLAERISASCSSDDGSCSWSVRRRIRAWKFGRVALKPSMRARETPCTSTRMRPSGSLSMRMMTATVPTSKRSSSPGSSSSLSRCATSRIIRLPESAWSTAWIDSSRATDSGAMMNG